LVCINVLFHSLYWKK